MFDLFVTGRRSSMRSGAVPLVVSWAVHALAMGLVVALPLLYATQERPDVPEAILAFVAVAPAPPPPPPPPPVPDGSEADQSAAIAATEPERAEDIAVTPAAGAC